MNKHERHLSSLKRIEGQVRGIQRMITQDSYCVDIITQIQAVRGALSRVEELVLQDHLDTCFTNSMLEGDLQDRKDKIDEVIQILKRSRK